MANAAALDCHIAVCFAEAELELAQRTKRAEIDQVKA